MARRRKQRLLTVELDDGEPRTSGPNGPANDGGMTTAEVARLIMPFVEGNGEVTLDDIFDYSRFDRRALRHHLSVLVKEGRLERIGVGRHAVYSAL
jgi:predicted transcriptional regulator of viral defense system